MKTPIYAMALFATSCAPAYANEFNDCYSLEWLTERFAEENKNIQMVLENDGMPNPGGQTILVANTNTGEWSMFVIGPDYPDLACVVQYGEGYTAGSLHFIPSDEGDDT